MNDEWQNARGDRWNWAHRDRVSRRTRYYFETEKNPDGPIRKKWRVCAHCHGRGTDDFPIEFHHLAYGPRAKDCFTGVWFCVRCHRKADHGGLRVRKKWVRNYWPLVKSRVRQKRWVDTPF